MLRALGDELFVDDESYLDMATALSGTGPAYVFLFMEALIDAGVHLGFSRKVAEQFVLQTMEGAVEIAKQSDLHPAQLRNMVTSPGGTSAEALVRVGKGALRTISKQGGVGSLSQIEISGRSVGEGRRTDLLQDLRRPSQ